MTEAFNGLTHAEAERLACIAEEMGEAIQIIGKILRHGYESYNPVHNSDDSNRQLLEKELGDVRYWMIEMCAWGDVNKSHVHSYAARKGQSVKKWLHHQGDEE